MSDEKTHVPTSASQPSRRSFLKTGLVGGGIFAVGLPVVRVGMWWNRRPGDGLECLSNHEFRIVEAMAEAMFPPGGVPRQSGKEMNVAMFVDAQLARMHEDNKRVLKAGLHALEDMTIIDAGEGCGFTPFTKLSLEQRERVLLEWEVSPVFPKRGLLRLYKWYIAMGVCEYPGVLEQMGVDYLCWVRDE